MTDTTPIPAGDTAILSPMQERTVEATSHPPLFKNPAVVAWLVPLAWSLGSIPAGWTWSGWGSWGPLPPGAGGLSGQFLAIALLVACVTDLRGRKIRNWTMYPAIVYGLLLNAMVSFSSGPVAEWLGGIGLLASLAGVSICFSGALCLFLLFRGGAGDVKLISMFGCYLGWRMAAEIWLITMLIAALFSVGWVAWRGAGVAVPLLSSALAHNSSDSRQMAAKLVAGWLKFKIPLAPFFLLGTVIAIGVPLAWPGHTALELLLRLT